MNKKWFEEKGEGFDPEPEESHDMPVVPYRVLHTGIPIFSDAECSNPVEGATIAILQPLDPAHQMGGLDVVPVRKHYSSGQLVGWVLDHNQVWEESWYRDPDDGQIQVAWTTHVEFMGPVISQQTVEDNRLKLDEIERQLAADAADTEGTPSIH